MVAMVIVYMIQMANLLGPPYYLRYDLLPIVAPCQNSCMYAVS